MTKKDIGGFAKRATAAYRSTSRANAPDGAVYLARIVPMFLPTCVLARKVEVGAVVFMDFAVVVLDRPPARFRWKIGEATANLYVFPKNSLERLLRQGISGRLRSLISSGVVVFGDNTASDELQSLARSITGAPRPILSASRLSEKRVLIEELQRDLVTGSTDDITFSLLLAKYVYEVMDFHMAVNRFGANSLREYVASFRERDPKVVSLLNTITTIAREGGRSDVPALLVAVDELLGVHQYDKIYG